MPSEASSPTSARGRTSSPAFTTARNLTARTTSSGTISSSVLKPSLEAVSSWEKQIEELKKQQPKAKGKKYY